VIRCSQHHAAIAAESGGSGYLLENVSGNVFNIKSKFKYREEIPLAETVTIAQAESLIQDHISEMGRVSASGELTRRHATSGQPVCSPRKWKAAEETGVSIQKSLIAPVSYRLVLHRIY